MAKKKIYVLDDCVETTFILEKWLQEKFDVEIFNTPHQFINRFQEEKPNLCILDVHLNDNRNGLDVLKEISQDTPRVRIPFVFISQEDQKHRKSSAYELGAVDYIKKPLDRNELDMKVSNIISLMTPHQEEEQFLHLDEDNLTLVVNGSMDKCVARLTPKEFIILKQLFKNKDSIVSREQILNKLENSLNEKFVVDRVIDVHVCNIKKKLGPYKDLINSVYGIGYKFDSSKAA